MSGTRNLNLIQNNILNNSGNSNKNSIKNINEPFGMCELCHNEDYLSSIDTKLSIIKMCNTCKNASRNLYFDTKSRQYLDNTQVSSLFDLTADRRLENIDTIIVCDLHNVTDLFEPEEFNAIIKKFHIPVVILSFLGIRGNMRKTTQTFINNYNSMYSFMCFVKDFKAKNGTKGKFINNILLNSNIKNVILLDDNIKNCLSAKAGGGKFIHVPSIENNNTNGANGNNGANGANGANNQTIKQINKIKEFIALNLRKLNNDIKRKRLLNYINTVNFFNSEILRKQNVSRKKNKQSRKKAKNKSKKKKPISNRSTNNIN